MVGRAAVGYMHSVLRGPLQSSLLRITSVEGFFNLLVFVFPSLRTCGDSFLQLAAFMTWHCLELFLGLLCDCLALPFLLTTSDFSYCTFCAFLPGWWCVFPLLGVCLWVVVLRCAQLALCASLIAATSRWTALTWASYHLWSLPPGFSLFWLFLGVLQFELGFVGAAECAAPHTAPAWCCKPLALVKSCFAARWHT